MYTKEEVIEKVTEISNGMDSKARQVEELRTSLLVDRGRLEELKNLYNMIVAKEQEAEKKKPAPKKRAKK